MPPNITDLDELLSDGPHDAALLIIAGRPSKGKTALAVHMPPMRSRTANQVYPAAELQNADLLDHDVAQLGRVFQGNVIQVISAKWNGIEALRAG